MTADADRMLSSDYLVDLEGRPIENIREMRDECVEVETGLSYLRRMVQGPLDIVNRELVRREVGGLGDRATLIEELPGILADGPRPAGVGRLSQSLEPTVVDAELTGELDSLLAGGVVSDVTNLGDRELVELQGRLEQFEERVSDRRRAYFDLIDALQAELTRRYRTGEASVDSLLS
ncbi:MAG TPA: hypothetical protein VIJ47_06945 [Acidimicrobiales bacterium]